MKDNYDIVDITDDIGLDDVSVRNAFKSGIDLRQYSAELQEKLRSAHLLAVKDCIDEAEKLAELHEEITACDDAFAFRHEKTPAAVDRYQSTTTKSAKIRGELSQFVDDMIVSQNMIQAIVERDVGEREFLEQLHELQHKLQFLKAQEFRDAKATSDVHDVIENLKYKAMAKIREWLLLKISSFKKPLTNYQIPQGALLKNRFFYEFLLANDRHLAREIRDEYVDVISKMFFTYFKTYASRLFRLLLADVATKDDLLGVENAVKTNSIFSLKSQMRNRATVFSLGNRDSLLSSDLMSPLIVPHAAQQANERFQFENLFRSLQFALVDHSSHEYLFISDFFMISGQTSFELFSEIMMRTINTLLKSCEEHISSNYDAISLYICIGLCSKYKELMIERKVPALESYWETLNCTLWNRFNVVMGLHNSSLRELDVHKMQLQPDTHPHYIVRRYAEFTSALLVCSQTSLFQIDPKLQLYLSKQQAEIEDFLTRIAEQLISRVQQLVCLINNYDLILNVLEERITFDSKEKSSFWELKQNRINEYVELVLRSHFDDLMSFVNECEPLIEQGHKHLLIRYSENVTKIVRSFCANWKKSIDAVNNEIVRSFTNFKNGTNILQMTFTQIVQYYHRFSKVLSHEAFAENAVLKELVNIHHIMVEIKKYKPVY
ncbi:Vacuolar protein sorting-associated protein 52-like [Dirofilaria immitis]|nr:Vacuolar protein sorting-associated protein 52-like [Dirofilaria immitis]